MYCNLKEQKTWKLQRSMFNLRSRRMRKAWEQKCCSLCIGAQGGSKYLPEFHLEKSRKMNGLVPCAAGAK